MQSFLTPEQQQTFAQVRQLAFEDRQRALIHAQDVMEGAGRAPWTYLLRGFCRAMVSDYAGARDDFEIAETEVKDLSLYFHQARTYLRLGEVENAALSASLGWGVAVQDRTGSGHRARALAVVMTALQGDEALSSRIAWPASEVAHEPLALLAAYSAAPKDGAQAAQALALLRANRGNLRKALIFWNAIDNPALRMADDKARLAAALTPAFDGHPQTFHLPVDRDRARAQLARDPDAQWIVKPTGLVGGQGIRFVRGDADLGDVDVPAVMQRYIDRPYLYEGRKVNIRLYAAIRSYRVEDVHIWHDGLVYVAPRPHDSGARAAQIVNPLLIDRDNPVQPVGAFPSQTVPLQEFLRTALGARADDVLSEIQCLASRAVLQLDQAGLFDAARSIKGWRHFPPKYFGFDITLDADLKPWLLEIERGPGMKARNAYWEGLLSRFQSDYAGLVTRAAPEAALGFQTVTRA